MKRFSFVVFAAALTWYATPALAHHGTGVSYDASKPTTLKGTVTEFRYANPHPQLYFDVIDDKGQVVHWSGEFYPNPAQLIQGGWGKKRSEAALAAGTKVTVTVAPSRAGTPVGAILRLVNDNGDVIMGVAGGGPVRGAPRRGAWSRSRRGGGTAMKAHIRAGIILSAGVALSAGLFAQGRGAAPAGGAQGRGAAAPAGRGGIMAANPANANKPYNKHDLMGIWSRNGTPGGYGGGGYCRDCGDRGYGLNVPALTPLGQKMFDANKPSYGRNLGSPDAAAHPEEPIGRRRSVPPANGTDPYQYCNPMGPSRALLYVDPVEFIVLPDRIYQHFEWGYGIRTIWTDGRPVLKDPDFPRWWGYSTSRWDGDTFVVTTTGVDDRTWVDYFGYPHSVDMVLEERYQRTAYDVLEMDMTVTDPKVYTAPFKSDHKKFRLIPKGSIKTVDNWAGLLEDICAPADEVDQFDKRVRDPAGGVIH